MRLGIENVALTSFGLLKKRRVGLLSHQAALLKNGATSAQCLQKARGVNLVALYGPEHGFFGQAAAGQQTASRLHPDWGIPVYSLYGEFRKPTPEMLKGIEVMVCDLQDLGVRCYTYLATLRNVLEACAESKIPVIIADRPIPLPEVVDGPMLDAHFSSFVAPCPLPMVYGMTPGEVAKWMVRKFALPLELKVVPMEGWCRKDVAWGASYPDWVPPSPGIKSWDTAMTYSSTVFSEALPGIDCGRGTNLAFRVIGAPWIRAEQTCQALKKIKLPGVTFNPYRYVAGTAPYQDCELDGIRLCVTNPATFKPVKTSVMLLDTLASLYGKKHVWKHDGVRPEWFDKLYGTSATRQALVSGQASEHVRQWTRASRAFMKERQNVLIYR
jgi:beta-N-acetylhexosaminidase